MSARALVMMFVIPVSAWACGGADDDPCARRGTCSAATGSAGDANSVAGGAQGGGGSAGESATGGRGGGAAGSSRSATGTGSCDSFVPAAYADLTAIPKLPDPFLSPDGTRISRRDQWDCRRAEIRAQAQEYELGPLPARPESVQGSFADDTLEITATHEGKTASFSVVISYPTTGSGPYPAMIGLGDVGIGKDALRDMGVATIRFPNDVVAAHKDQGSRGVGAFFDLYGSSHAAGAMMAWAWGVSRLIDALETTPDARIDPSRLGVTGCSRNGKGALIAGAFEDRIALTVPQESGSGGSASWRISDAQMAGGTTVQTLSEITGENVWFRQSFKQFNGSAKKLPFDHHMIEGLIAPRALLVIENTSMVWLGNVSTYTNSMAAHKIWEALGAPDAMGVSQVGDHEHCTWNGSQQAEVTAYVQKFLVGGGTADTKVLKTDGDYSFDEAAWVDWSVPELQ